VLRLSTVDRLAMLTGRRGKVRQPMATALRPIISQDPRPGRVVLTVSQYEAALSASTPQRRLSMLGHSPGKAAQLAGISRAAIHKAIDRGTLEAFYVHDDQSGQLRWIVIPDHSLRDYIRRNRS